MNHHKFFKSYLITISILGSFTILFALFNFDIHSLDWASGFFLISALLITSQLTLSLPRSNSHFSFSDTMIFFAFLFYGGELAIILATIEVGISCLKLKYNGIEFGNFGIPFNISSTAFSTAITYLVWARLPKLGLPHSFNQTNILISILSILALTQFLASSTFAAIFYALKNNKNVFQMWKDICFSSSTTQIAGAGLAGVIFKLINYSDIFLTAISFIIFAVAYLNYRQMVQNINDSINKAEKAEREKAYSAQQQAEKAQEHSVQLQILLKKEEKISQHLRKSKEDLEYAAFHDSLTDLPNRAYLIERLDLLLQLGLTISEKYYVLFIDLSRFKNINDSLGHTIGDEVLKVVALRLRRCLRDEDTISRLGGDEFAVILNDLSSIDEAMEFAKRIYEKLTKPFMISGNKIFSDLHIGITPFDSEQIKPEDVLRDADIAMHNAKNEKVGIAVFDKNIRTSYLENIRLEGDLRYAIERNELSMHYQPLISLKDGQLLGFEALLRWHHGDLGFISPAKFIPISEDSGSIIPITKWILNQSCFQLEKWKKISDDYKDLLVSINISGKHLAEEELIEDVQNALNLSNLSPNSLKLEITETTAMENPAATIKILNKLKDIGVQISIDDFGTGYSSLNYLHKLPFDTLKIDRSFVIEASEGNENSNILQTIVSLTKNLKKEAIAEGIETKEQLKMLVDLGCDYGQGYLFSRPLPVDEMEKMLYKKTNWYPASEIETFEHRPLVSNPEINLSLVN